MIENKEIWYCVKRGLCHCGHNKQMVPWTASPVFLITEAGLEPLSTPVLALDYWVMFHPHNSKDSSINQGGECWCDKQIRLHHKKIGRIGGKLTQILYQSSCWKLSGEEDKGRIRRERRERSGRWGWEQSRSVLCGWYRAVSWSAASAHKSNEREKEKHLSWPSLCLGPAFPLLKPGQKQCPSTGCTEGFTGYNIDQLNPILTN